MRKSLERSQQAAYQQDLQAFQYIDDIHERAAEERIRHLKHLKELDTARAKRYKSRAALNARRRQRQAGSPLRIVRDEEEKERSRDREAAVERAKESLRFVDANMSRREFKKMLAREKAEAAQKAEQERQVEWDQIMLKSVTQDAEEAEQRARADAKKEALLLGSLKRSKPLPSSQTMDPEDRLEQEQLQQRPGYCSTDEIERELRIAEQELYDVEAGPESYRSSSTVNDDGLLAQQPTEHQSLLDRSTNASSSQVYSAQDYSAPTRPPTLRHKNKRDSLIDMPSPEHRQDIPRVDVRLEEPPPKEYPPLRHSGGRRSLIIGNDEHVPAAFAKMSLRDEDEARQSGTTTPEAQSMRTKNFKSTKRLPRRGTKDSRK